MKRPAQGQRHFMPMRGIYAGRVGILRTDLQHFVAASEDTSMTLRGIRPAMSVAVLERFFVARFSSTKQVRGGFPPLRMSLRSVSWPISVE